MKWSYIPTKASILALAMMISAQAQPDTVVLNSTEFQFPETHPGRVFVVKKVVVNGQQSLKKGVEAGNPASPVLGAPASATSGGPTRDVMGRVLKSGEYAKRMANIQKVHRLPTVAAGRTQFEKAPARQAVSLFQKSNGARFALTSESPLIQTWQELARMEKAEREAVRRKYGALGKAFGAKVAEMRENDSLDILIELEAEHPGYLNGMKTTLEERKRNAQAWAESRPRIAPADFLRQHGLKARGAASERGMESRTVVVRASKRQVLGLKHVPGVVSIGLASVPVLNAVPGTAPHSLYELLASAKNPEGAMVEHGGLAVATLETGLSEDYVNRVPYNLAPADYSLSWQSYPAHSEGTYHALAIGTTGHTRYHYEGWGARGAPDNDYGHGFGHILSQIMSNGISVLSSSFGARNYAGSSVAGDSVGGPWDELVNWDSRNVDRLAYIYPYPVVFLTAGNDGYAVTSDSKTYNSMVVGNVQHYDNTSYSVTIRYGSGSLVGSQTKNAPAIYGSTDDWESPNLVAPGQSPDPWWGLSFDYVHINNLGNSWCGTGGSLWCPPGGSSFSAPIAAAMGANVMAARYVSGSSRNTEARAMLMLTAQNVDSGYWAPGLQDSRDGAGTVSGANAVHFATNATSVEPDAYPVTNGISSGSFDYDNFYNWSGANYNYRVPSSLPSGKHLRVVLTWNSSPGYNAVENEVSDLGLAVQSNQGWHSSDAWNGNTEIIDIGNSDLTPNGVYSIELTPKVYRTASDGPQSVDYTVAWTWVKDHAD